MHSRNKGLTRLIQPTQKAAWLISVVVCIKWRSKMKRDMNLVRSEWCQVLTFELICE